ncbi:MAG TPA: CDP-alcohol phosphatidyltransferase family protein [Thermoanaerobaculia bacterium]|nr:CDP-alcohol phosphatidyltransferase family protein [Thermoanaerobaculia bacterium]
MILTIPNILTLARYVMVPFFLWASFERMYTVAFVLFVTAAATDILDGMIARRLNQKSRLGALLDPGADKSLMICGFLFYTLADGLPFVTIPAWLTFVVFIRDFSILMVAYLLYTRVNVKKFPPSVAGKTSTVLQAVCLGTAIGVNAFAHTLLWFAEFMFRVALLITLYSSWDYLRRGERLLYDGLAAANLDGAPTVP